MGMVNKMLVKNLNGFVVTRMSRLLLIAYVRAKLSIVDLSTDERYNNSELPHHEIAMYMHCI